MSQAHTGSNVVGVQAALSEAQSGSPVNAAALASFQGDLNLAAAGGVTSKTTVKSLAGLKKLSPKLYNQMLQSIASDMMIDFQRREDRLEKAMKALCNPEDYPPPA